MLPEDCLSRILSLTSPIDACRSSVVSTDFNSASESDLVWERFLPSDHQDLISRIVDSAPLKLSTNKQLFFHLCNPLLIDAGKKSFKIEPSTGKKSYLLSARELQITWSDEPMYWFWKHSPHSRFAQVVELRTISWLEIHGKIRTQTLSKNTTYCAYLVTNISPRAYGLATKPFETSIQVGNQQVCHGTIILSKHDHVKTEECDDMLRSKPSNQDKIVSITERTDGWMEIKLGEFFVDEETRDREVKMSLSETKGYHLKAGLVIEGIEVRPKD